MSRLYDAIRIAREAKSTSRLNDSDALGAMELPDRRITPRMDLFADLTVYGRSACEDTFYEQGKAISGNANGGVFLLAIPVVEGQDLLLINNTNSQEQVCTVKKVRTRDIRTSEISVSFPAPNSDFWCSSATAGS